MTLKHPRLLIGSRATCCCLATIIVLVICVRLSANGTDDRSIKDGPAKQYKYPFVASLRRPTANRPHYCGGTLITRRHVLTAAHCLTMFNIRKPIVHLGRYAREGKSDQGLEIMRTIRVTVHPAWDADHIDGGNDVAILELNASSRHPPVQLPLLRLDIQPFTELTVLGWGIEGTSSRFADELQMAKVPYIDAYKCNSPSSYRGNIDSTRMMCAGNGMRDACRGDSGGPLILEAQQGQSSLMLQVGIVSWGYGCGNPRFPGVYTRVSAYMPWIRSEVFTRSLPAPGESTASSGRDRTAQQPALAPMQAGQTRTSIAPIYLGQDGFPISMPFLDVFPTGPGQGFARAGNSLACRSWTDEQDGRLGYFVHVSRYPYIVSLRTRDGIHRCSGAMIDRWHFVTSAICMVPEVGVGESPLACVGCFYTADYNPDFEEEGELIPAVFAELPPAWEGLSTPNLAGDIAVVRLERPTSLGRLPVQLAPPGTRLAPNCSLALLKYGSFQLGGPTSSALHAVDLPYVDRRTCSMRWQQYAVSITELQICAGGTGDVGSCDGDQGAPLILSADDDPRNDMLVGVSSFGPPNSCGGGEQGIPDVFVDIPALHEFIRAAAGHGQ